MFTVLENLAILEMVYPVGAAVVWFWFGACIGSFLNVCIWRVPNGMSLISPPSHCPKCGHPIPFYENIPIFSWFFLRGKCSSCHGRISVRYPIVETLTAMVFLCIHLMPHYAFCAGGWTGLRIPSEILMFTAASVLIASAFTDCDCRIIPDGFVMTLLGAEILYAVLASVVPGGDWITVSVFFMGQMLAMGVLLSGIALLGKALCHKTALGWGDVKLLTVLTPVMTIYGISWIILLASILLVICAPAYRKLKPKMRHRAMPFGPFIAIAASIVLPLLPRLLPLVREMR